MSRLALTRRMIAGLGALALAAFLASGCTMNVATGERQLTLISEAQEIAMGREADEQIQAEMGVYGDEALARYIHDLGTSLAAKSERPNLPWQFRVIDDPIVNAFALPGGFIYVTRGILAHLDSEAELVGVLGHEIGHVTGRHSVEQMSKAELATLGLGVAVIAAGEEGRRYGGLAQAGLGVLFLKFGRDDERQADSLGLRYLTRAAYDPREMPHVFRTLDRVSSAAGAGRIPNWLATHPAPEDRIQRLTAAIAQLPPEAQSGAVNRDAYVERLAGLTFGPNPREGFFEDNVFYHPDMAFKLTFPRGFKVENQKQAVGAISPAQDAMVVLALANAKTPEEAAQVFFNQQGIERGEGWRRNFYAFRTLPPSDPQAQQGFEEIRGVAGFFEHGGRVFQLRGLAKGGVWSGYREAMLAALGSFERLTDRRILDVQPKKLELVRLPAAMSFEEFLRRYPSSVDAQALAIANGVEPGAQLEAGRLMKRVVGGEP